MTFDQVPIRYLTQMNRMSLPEETAPDREFHYIDISQVTGNGEIEIPPETMTFADAPSRARRIAADGDVVVSTVRTYLRAVASVPDSADSLVFSTGFAVLSPNSWIDPRFLGFACQSDMFIDEVVARSVGISYPAINAGDMAAIPLPAPPLDVQRRIADFLDDQRGCPEFRGTSVAAC